MMQCHIYRSSKKEGMYLYVPQPVASAAQNNLTSNTTDKRVIDGQAHGDILQQQNNALAQNDASAQVSAPVFDPLQCLPEALRYVFGRADFVMALNLSEGRKLAQANVLHVMDALVNKGFYIQMPPDGFINPTAVPEGLRGA